MKYGDRVSNARERLGETIIEYFAVNKLDNIAGFAKAHFRELGYTKPGTLRHHLMSWKKGMRAGQPDYHYSLPFRTDELRTIEGVLGILNVEGSDPAVVLIREIHPSFYVSVNNTRKATKNPQPFRNLVPLHHRWHER